MLSDNNEIKATFGTLSQIMRQKIEVGHKLDKYFK